MKVLVTGGGGFIGGRIVRRLLRLGYSVRSYGRKERKDLEAEGVEVWRGDLTDAAALGEACRDVGAVFHVAARAGVWGSWESFYEPNVTGTRNVLAACRARGVGRLIHTSTPSVVFDRSPIRGADESKPYGRKWLGAYAPTKRIAEEEVLAADGGDLKVVALRPHLVFGPGDPHLLPRVIAAAVSGRLKIIGRGDNRVDVSFIEDVADAHMLAFEALETAPEKVRGRAYFISRGEPVQLWPWLNGILGRLGHPPLQRKIPLPAAYAAAGLCEGFWRLARRTDEPPLTRFAALELAKDHYFSIEAARRDLGYVPKVDMEAAVSATVRDLKERGFG